MTDLVYCSLMTRAAILVLNKHDETAGTNQRYPQHGNETLAA